MIARRVLTCMVAVALSAGAVEASHRKEQPRKHRVVYHLTDGGGEPVVHGAALKSFVTTDMDPALRGALDRLQTQGLALGACGNTMKGMSISLEQLPEGTRPLPQGGVVRVMELQEAGYAYVRP